MLHTVLLAALASSPPAAPAPPPPQEALDTLDHVGLTVAIDVLAAAHAHVSKSLVGRSRDGRVIEALTLAPEGAAEDRPGLLIVGGLQGAEAFSSTLALHHARALAEGYGTHAGATALLDAWTVYVVPRANPDAVEAFFEVPRYLGTATGRGVDDDRDGQQGEDPLVDVDGDGLITWMRYEDPEGTWLPDPTDPRVLVEADRSKGERGAWKLVREALDQDGDEELGEDGPENAVVDRNFPAGWDEHAPDAGLWPTHEPEALALVEFVLGHPGLTTVVVYGAHDNLVEVPDGVDDDAPPRLRIPPSGMRASDVAALEPIAERYRELTGNETTGAEEDGGSFQRWAYEHRGLLVLCARPWTLPTEESDAAEEADEEASGDQGEAVADEAAPEAEPGQGDEDGADEAEPAPEPSDDAKRLAWIDARLSETWRFDAWEPFEHPTLGPVEVGGFAPYAHTEPPRAVIEGIADAHLAWLVTLADERPRLAIPSFTKERLGEGLWRVELVLENVGRMPLLTRTAELTRTLRPARVTLRMPDDATLLGGRRQVLVGDLPGIDGRFEETWLIQVDDDAEIGVEVDTDHAEDLQATAEVKS